MSDHAFSESVIKTHTVKQINIQLIDQTPIPPPMNAPRALSSENILNYSEKYEFVTADDLSNNNVTPCK